MRLGQAGGMFHPPTPLPIYIVSLWVTMSDKTTCPSFDLGVDNMLYLTSIIQLYICERASMHYRTRELSVQVSACQKRQCNLWVITEVLRKQKQSCFVNNRHAESGDFLFFSPLTLLVDLYLLIVTTWQSTSNRQNLGLSMPCLIAQK